MKGEGMGRGFGSGTVNRQNEISSYRDVLKDKRRDELVKMKMEKAAKDIKRKRDAKESKKKRIKQLKLNALKTHWLNDKGLQMDSFNNRTLQNLKNKIQEALATHKSQRLKSLYEALCESSKSSSE